MRRKRRRLDATFFILGGMVLIAVGIAAAKDPALPWQGIKASGQLFSSVWVELALGFILAGMIEVLVPDAVVAKWLGGDNLHTGILAGWGAGFIMPGGPYVFFPIAAKLFDSGAAPGALIAFITAKTLVSPVRMLTYEAPLLGWPLTLARFIPGLLVAPILGYIGQWLYELFKPK
jgi:uncharacterized membrane protein YraQ (UPF0718 family)